MNRFASFVTKAALAGSLLGAGLAANAQVNLYLVPITPLGTVTAGSTIQFAFVVDITANNLSSLTIGAGVTYDRSVFDPNGFDPNQGYTAADGPYSADKFWNRLGGTASGTTTTGPNGVGLPVLQTSNGRSKVGTSVITPGTHTVATFSYPTLATASGDATIYLPDAFLYNNPATAVASSEDTVNYVIAGVTTQFNPSPVTFFPNTTAKPASLTYQISGGAVTPAPSSLLVVALGAIPAAGLLRRRRAVK